MKMFTLSGLLCTTKDALEKALEATPLALNGMQFLSPKWVWSPLPPIPADHF